jgi:hypothetical protein
MRNQIRALFTSPSGKLPIYEEMDAALANADSNSRLRSRDYVNCFGVRSQFVYPTGIKSFDNTKEKFALVLMAIGKQDEVDDFQEKFDKLRDLIISAWQTQETHLALPNARTSKDQRIITPETGAKIVTAYAANPDTKQIATEFGVSATSILRFVKAANEKVMPRGWGLRRRLPCPSV